MIKQLKTLLLGTTLALTAALPSAAQNDARFHFELDYSYQLGFSESLHNYNYHNAKGMGGHSLTINALYNIRPDITVGVGYGLARYTEEDGGGVNTMPLYATLRYRPFATHRAAYAYTDLGYALMDKKEESRFSSGVHGALGVGYQLMFKRHFGLNFKLGYEIRQMRNIPVYYDIPASSQATPQDNTGHWAYGYTSLWRHSLQMGIGLVF